MQHNPLGTPPKETPSENKLGKDNLPVSWAVLTSPSMLWSAFTLAHLSTRSPSLTLRWMNPKKNKKWVQLHMSAMSQHVDEGCQRAELTLSRWIVSAYLSQQSGYAPLTARTVMTADSPHEAAFPVATLAYVDLPALLSRGSPVGWTCTCTILYS